MFGICKDDSCAIKDRISLDKKYEILNMFDDSDIGVRMVSIIADNGKEYVCRLNRFYIHFI